MVELTENPTRIIRVEELAPSGVPAQNRSLVLMAEQAGGITVQQRFEVFNQQPSAKAHVVFTGIGSGDVHAWNSGSSRTFNTMVQSFEQTPTWLIHWPNVYIPEVLIRQIFDYAKMQDIEELSFFGRSFGGAAILEAAAYAHANNVQTRINGMVFLVAPTTYRELKPWPKFQAISAGFVMKSALMLANKITGDERTGAAAGRVAKLRRKPYTADEFDRETPVLVFTTDSQRDPAVDTDAAAQVLESIFRNFHHVKLEGQPYFRIKGRRPVFNSAGVHEVKSSDVARMQKHTIRFLTDPARYNKSDVTADESKMATLQA